MMTDFQENLDALDAGICTAQCILSRDDEECDCRCEGKFHGLMRDPHATAPRDPFKGMWAYGWPVACEDPGCCGSRLPAGLWRVVQSAGFHDGAFWLVMEVNDGQIKVFRHDWEWLEIYESREIADQAWDYGGPRYAMDRHMEGQRRLAEQSARHLAAPR